MASNTSHEAEGAPGVQTMSRETGDTIRGDVRLEFGDPGLPDKDRQKLEGTHLTLDVQPPPRVPRARG
eukprot:2768578-Pyramimonas_sp.AAC.1